MFQQGSGSGSSSATSSFDDSWAPVPQTKVKPKKTRASLTESMKGLSIGKRVSTSSKLSTGSRRTSISSQAHCETCTCFGKQRKTSEYVSIYALFTKCVCKILKDKTSLLPGLATATTEKEKMKLRGPFISKVWKLVKPVLVEKGLYQGPIHKSEADAFIPTLMTTTQNTINKYLMQQNVKKNKTQK
jgi:hypothetical protein